MKRYFPAYYNRLKASAKRVGGITPRELVENLHLDPKIDPHLSRSFVSELDALEGRAHHYFIDTPELADWMSQTVKTPPSDFLDIFGCPDGKRTTGIIHTCGPRALAMLFCVNKCVTPNILEIYAHNAREENLGTGDAKFNGAGCLPLVTPGLEHTYGLFLGFILYLKAFPESVKPGVPDFAQHPAWFHGTKSFSVATSKRILDRDSSSPHWRDCHYRVLRSPYFTQKQYQVVFVKGAVVNAKDGGFFTIEDQPRRRDNG